jgi:CRP/FNR family cyclic AMP-dependent transcriptional regulator
MARTDGGIMRRVLYMLGQLSDDNIEWMIARGKRENTPAGTVLIEEGKPSPLVYIVLDGLLGIFVKAGQGENLIAQRSVGEILGEMSFIDDSPPTATVKTLEPSILFTLPKATLADHLQEDRDFAARFYRGIAVSLSYRLRESMERSGPGTSMSGEVDEDEELDANVLDSVYLAGMRFDRIVRRMMEM